MKAGNTALKILEDLEVDSFRSPSDLDILFHHSDPKEIRTTHGPLNADTLRKPDVILTSLAAAQWVLNPEKLTCSGLILLNNVPQNLPTMPLSGCSKKELEFPPDLYIMRPPCVPHNRNPHEKFDTL